VTVEFALEFTAPGTAQWIWKARFEDASICDFTDAVRSTLEVGTVLPLLREVQLVRAENAGDESAAKSESTGAVRPGHSEGNARQLAAGGIERGHFAFAALSLRLRGTDFLQHVALALLQEAPELITFTQRGTNDAAAAIQAGLRRLWSMQTSSGGAGVLAGRPRADAVGERLWRDVMAIARQAGITVPEKEFGRVMDYLSSALRSDSVERDALGDQCLALYTLALAGRAEPAYHEKLFGQRGRLSPESRALLALQWPPVTAKSGWWLNCCVQIFPLCARPRRIFPARLGRQPFDC